MTEENKQNKEAEILFLSWMQASADFWSHMAEMMPMNPDNGQQNQAIAGNRFMEQLQANVNFMKTFSQAMKEPESAAATLKSINALPEIVLKMAKSSWEANFKMQQNILEKAGKIGQRTEAYNFDNLDQEVFFKALTDIYEQELKQYFHIPQLGLTRFYQERFNELLDKHNILKTTLAEFFAILYLPMEKSVKVMQEQLRTMAEAGMMPKETKEHYALWIKILEGHYMKLFKSKEYLTALHNTLSRVEDFAIAKNDALRDILQFCAVPTNKEMDDLYREFHVLKKRVKELEEIVKSA